MKRRRNVQSAMSLPAFNFLDRVIGAFSPQSLVKRGQSRVAAYYIDKAMKRTAYKAAEENRLTGDWITSNEDINVILQRELPLMRARSRWLLRNNPHAGGVMNAYLSHIIGTGLTLQCRVARSIRTVNAEGNAAIEQVEMDAWNDFNENNFQTWAESADITSTELLPESFVDDQELFLRRLVEDGEALVFLGVNNKFSGVPLRLMFIEPDALDSGVTEYEGNPVIMGVEVDKRTYKPLAYHLVSGNIEYASFSGLGKTLRIEANNILHVFKRLRPKQVRGIPFMAVVTQNFFNLDSWTDAELIGNKIAACFGVMVEMPDSDDKPNALGVDGDKKVDDTEGKIVDSEGNPLSTVEPGIIGYGPEGMNVHVVSPQKPGATFDMFAKYNLKAIGAGMQGGISYPAMTRDTTGQTFAGGRLAQQMDHLAFRQFQGFVSRKFCSPIYRRWLEISILYGTTIAPGYYENPKFWEKHIFLPSGWPRGINPLQDINASIKSMEAGITTYADECALIGKDPKTQMRVAMKAKNAADGMGLVLKGVNEAAKELKIEAASVAAIDPEQDAEAQELLAAGSEE